MGAAVGQPGAASSPGPAVGPGPSGQTLLGVVGSHGDLAVNPNPLSLQPQQIKPGGRGGHEPRPGAGPPEHGAVAQRRCLPPDGGWPGTTAVAGTAGPCDWGTSFPEAGPPGPGPGHTHACQRVNRAGRTWLPSQGRGQSPVYSPVRHPRSPSQLSPGTGRLGQARGRQGLCLAPSSAALGRRDGSSPSLSQGRTSAVCPTGHLLIPGHKVWHHWRFVHDRAWAPGKAGLRPCGPALRGRRYSWPGRAPRRQCRAWQKVGVLGPETRSARPWERTWPHVRPSSCAEGQSAYWALQAAPEVGRRSWEGAWGLGRPTGGAGPPHRLRPGSLRGPGANRSPEDRQGDRAKVRKEVCKGVSHEAYRVRS